MKRNQCEKQTALIGCLLMRYIYTMHERRSSENPFRYALAVLLSYMNRNNDPMRRKLVTTYNKSALSPSRSLRYFRLILTTLYKNRVGRLERYRLKFWLLSLFAHQRVSSTLKLFMHCTIHRRRYGSSSSIYMRSIFQCQNHTRRQYIDTISTRNPIAKCYPTIYNPSMRNQGAECVL